MYIGILYISDRACQVYRVWRCSVLNECPVELFRGSVVFVRVCIKSVCHGQQQTKALFRQYCVRLLRILEDDIVEYKSLLGNSYAILCHVLLLASWWFV